MLLLYGKLSNLFIYVLETSIERMKRKRLRSSSIPLLTVIEIEVSVVESFKLRYILIAVSSFLVFIDLKTLLKNQNLKKYQNTVFNKNQTLAKLHHH